MVHKITISTVEYDSDNQTVKFMNESGEFVCIKFTNLGVHIESQAIKILQEASDE